MIELFSMDRPNRYTRLRWFCTLCVRVYAVLFVICPVSFFMQIKPCQRYRNPYNAHPRKRERRKSLRLLRTKEVEFLITYHVD